MQTLESLGSLIFLIRKYARHISDGRESREETIKKISHPKFCAIYPAVEGNIVRHIPEIEIKIA